MPDDATTIPGGESRWTVDVGDGTVSAAVDRPSSGGERAPGRPRDDDEVARTARNLGGGAEPRGGSSPVFVFAHGAGGNMNDRGVAATSKALVARGITVVRFNFPYRERKSGRPDAMPRLMETFAAVVARARAELRPATLVIGGRSMGGRTASMLAADGFDADGLLLLAYPLHPAGQPHKLRDAHLAAIRMPVLAFSGTRDALCTRELMETALRTVTAPWEMRWIETADHSFHVLKSSGLTDAGVVNTIADESAGWMRGLAANR